MKYDPCPHGIERTRKSKDGLTAKCPECLKLRDKNRANNPERVKTRQDYAKTEAYRLSHNKASRRYDKTEKGKTNKKKWQEENNDKRIVHGIVAYRIKTGELIRLPCEVCGEEKSEAHHDDYERPLEVRWLCTKHHAEHHKQQRIKERDNDNRKKIKRT